MEDNEISTENGPQDHPIVKPDEPLIVKRMRALVLDRLDFIPKRKGMAWSKDPPDYQMLGYWDGQEAICRDVLRILDDH